VCVCVGIVFVLILYPLVPSTKDVALIWKPRQLFDAFAVQLNFLTLRVFQKRLGCGWDVDVDVNVDCVCTEPQRELQFALHLDRLHLELGLL